MREGIARNVIQPEVWKALPPPTPPRLQVVATPPPPPEPRGLLAGLLTTLGDVAVCWPALPKRDQGDDG